MNTKQPQRLTLQSMFNKLTSQITTPNNLFYKDGFAIAIDVNRLLKPFVTPLHGPYLMEDYRLGIVKNGFMHGIINLQEYQVEAGSIIFICPGSIVDPMEMSNDFQVMGVGIPADLFHLAHSGNLPELFNGQQKHGIQKACEQELQLLDHMIRLLWEIANKQVSQQVMFNQVATITTYFNELFARQQSQMATHRQANDIFDRFIRLVNNHYAEQRQLAFYAEKICITERYLGTVIRQTSGITAKEWIDKAVITAAKVKLRHSNLQIAEITEALNFPNASFFCKYFKRLVGCTPQEYRQGKNDSSEDKKDIVDSPLT